MKLKINAQPRVTVRKSDVNSLRLKGEIPAVIYGMGTENKLVSVDEREFTKSYRQAIGELAIWDITSDGKTYSAIIREKQIHPVTRKVVHIDFLVLQDNKAINLQIPLKFAGEAPGIKMGGVLEIFVRSLEISALPGNLPEDIVVDLSGLQVGQSIHVSDLAAQNFEFKVPLNLAIAAVHGKVE